MIFGICNGWGYLLVLFLSLSLLICVYFYYDLDPMKCRFFLVLSLVGLSFFFSLGLYLWYSYFICLVFLSGVFIILVYFSRLSSFIYVKKPLWMVFFFFCLLVGKVEINYFSGFVGVNELYYNYYLWFVVMVIVSLIFFLGFVRYNVVLGSALRKM